MRKGLLLFVTLLSLYSISTAKEVPFTQEDRDRITRLEVKVEEGFKAVNQRMDDVNRRIDDVNKRIDDTNRRIEDTNKRIEELQTLMLWGFGILFGGMGILIGLVMWDRRTAISPVAKKTKELEDRSDKIEKVLKSLAKRNPEVEE
ncbi:MAG: coiled-coil domain-containing protein, partial [Aquificaceae bacterium]